MKTNLAGQWLARIWRRLTVARRRRFHTVFPNAEFAGECKWANGAASMEPLRFARGKNSGRTGVFSVPLLIYFFTFRPSPFSLTGRGKSLIVILSPGKAGINFAKNLSSHNAED